LPPQRGNLSETFTLGPLTKYDGQVLTRKGALIWSEMDEEEEKASRGSNPTPKPL